ncbi:MAG: site-specific tyrosine recombinase/integron integrase [Candidatus Methylomirabilis sp.]
MGKLAERFERDLTIRGYSDNTRRIYLGHVRNFARFFKRSPDELTVEHINQYQYHLLRDKKVARSYFNVISAALRFFYLVTLEKDWNIKRRIPYHKTGRRLPEILSQQEVVRFFTAIPNLKHRAIVMTLYAGGLRISEALHLRPSDIDSQRMVIRIEQGKGRKDRYVPLSPVLLTILREYWKIVRPKSWLFPNPFQDKPLVPRTICKVVEKACGAAGIRKKVRTHSMRHSFATHLMDKGVNIRIIQTLLGHRSLRSTEIYTHVSKTYLQDTKSPLDDLSGLPGPLPPKK